MQLNILHVTPSYYPATQFGGPIQSVHQLNRALIAQGVSVEVYTTNAGLESMPEFQSSKWQVIEGVKVKFFPYYGYVHYNFSPQLLISLFQSVKKYKLVHITAVWNFPVLAASLACQWYKVPYVISPRGTIYPETIALKSSRLKRLYYWLFARNCLKHAKAIHYTAQDERDKVTQHLGLTNPAWVIPNGIDLKHFNQAYEINALTSYFPLLNNRPYLLFLGRISRKKGLDIFIEAFAQLSDIYVNLMLVIVGPDEEGYRREVERLVDRYQLRQRVIFTGILEDEKKLAAYRSAVMFVLPSYSENFGMSVVEAMACNTPVVISDQVGIHQDIEANQAGIVVHTNAQSLATGIRTLLEDPHKREEISKNGSHMVQMYYSIQQVAQHFTKAYDNLI